MFGLSLAFNLVLANVVSADNQAAGKIAVDLVFLNGKIWTVNKAEPEAEALAVWHGRVVAVGRNDAIRTLAGSRTRTIDLKGRRVVPGFYDSHVHFLGSGQRLS